VPFGHTSPAPFGGTLPKGEGLGVVVLNNHLRDIIYKSRDGFLGRFTIELSLRFEKK